ncbi:hypothetical protein FB451DRAFT_1185449 [Mycena latifolia]|nr:hypothetical protein FB451DRAFT_1185449 [Mycena latifolia]
MGVDVLDNAVSGAPCAEDKFKNLGARLIQAVAQKTNEIAGDGTTAATVLARALYSEGVKPSTASSSSSPRTLPLPPRSPRSRASPRTGAPASAASSRRRRKVGKEGVITVKEGRTIGDEIEMTQGMRFDRCFISPYLVTDVKARKFELDAIHPQREDLAAGGHPAAAQARRPLVDVAEDVDREALAACILSKLRGQLHARHHGEHRRHQGGQDMIVLSAEDAIAARSSWTHVSRAASVLKVGGASEVEVHEKKHRYDDALNAARVAVEEGVLPGDGVALVKTRLMLATSSSERPPSISSLMSPDTASLPIANSRKSASRSCAGHSPARGGECHPRDAVWAVRRRGQVRAGYDAATDEYVNMVKAGIVDPGALKVVRTALVDAAGVPSLLPTSECSIAEAPERRAPRGVWAAGWAA